MSTKYFATEPVTVVAPAIGKRFELGAHQEVPEEIWDKMSSGTKKSLLQTNRVQAEKDYQPPPAIIEQPDNGAEGEGHNQSGGNPTQDSAWKETLVESLNLEPRIKGVLQENNLTTVGQVLEEGAKDQEKGLQAITGIAEPSEKAIQAAIEEVMPKT